MRPRSIRLAIVAGAASLAVLGSTLSQAQTIPNNATGFLKWCTERGMQAKGQYNFGKVTNEANCEDILFNELYGLSEIEEGPGCKELGKEIDVRTAYNAVLVWMRGNPQHTRGSARMAIVTAANALWKCPVQVRRSLFE